MGYIINNCNGEITEQFDTIEELNNFTLTTVNEASASGLIVNQYVWPDDETLNTYFDNSNEIGKSYFRFIYTTEQFQNL